MKNDGILLPDWRPRGVEWCRKNMRPTSKVAKVNQRFCWNKHANNEVPLIPKLSFLDVPRAVHSQLQLVCNLDLLRVNSASWLPRATWYHSTWSISQRVLKGHPSEQRKHSATKMLGEPPQVQSLQVYESGAGIIIEAFLTIIGTN